MQILSTVIELMNFKNFSKISHLIVVTKTYNHYTYSFISGKKYHQNSMQHNKFQSNSIFLLQVIEI